MKNFKSIIATGVLAASLFAMTGCSSAQETTPDVAATVSAQPTSTETTQAAETAAPEAAETIVWKVSVEEVLAKHIIANPKTGLEMDTVFPADKFDRKEGVRSALAFYEKLVNIQQFQQVRPAGSDKELITAFAGSEEYKVDKRFMDDLNKNIDANGYLANVIPSADLNAVIGEKDGIVYHAADAPAQIVQTEMPQVYVETAENGYGDLLTVHGYYTLTKLTKEGVVATAPYEYTVSVSAGAVNETTKKQEWIVSGITLHSDANDVVLTDAKSGARV